MKKRMCKFLDIRIARSYAEDPGDRDYPPVVVIGTLHVQQWVLDGLDNGELPELLRVAVEVEPMETEPGNDSLADDDAGARRLLAALLLRAARDAESSDSLLATEARRYLEGEGCDAAEMLSIHPARVRAWLESLAEVGKDLERCTYADWQVTELLDVSKAVLQKLGAAGILVPDVPGGKYSAVALLEFLWKGDEQDGS